MSYQAVDAVLKHSRTEKGDRTLLIVLAHHVHPETGECFPGTERLARCCKVTERTIERRRSRLLESGEVSIVEKGGGYSKSHRYRLNLPEIYPDEAVGVSNKKVDIPGTETPTISPDYTDSVDGGRGTEKINEEGMPPSKILDKINSCNGDWSRRSLLSESEEHLLKKNWRIFEAWSEDDWDCARWYYARWIPILLHNKPKEKIWPPSDRAYLLKEPNAFLDSVTPKWESKGRPRSRRVGGDDTKCSVSEESSPKNLPDPEKSTESSHGSESDPLDLEAEFRIEKLSSEEREELEQKAMGSMNQFEKESVENGGKFGQMLLETRMEELWREKQNVSDEPDDS